MNNTLELFNQLRESYSPARNYYHWVTSTARSSITIEEWLQNVYQKIASEQPADIDEFIARKLVFTLNDMSLFQFVSGSSVGDLSKEMITHLRERTITPFTNRNPESDTDIAVTTTYEPIIPGSDTRPAFVIPGIEISRNFKSLIQDPFQQDLAVASTILTCARIKYVTGA